MAETIYDCIIVGAGPAGLASAIYTARDRYKTLVLEKFYPGGQINNTGKIENFPGFMQVGGQEFAGKLYEQAMSFGAEIKTGAAVRALKRREDAIIEVETKKQTYLAKTVILCPGSNYRKLGVPGEEQLTGTGVSYCGTCDAPFFRDKEVISVGGGNTALEEAMHLAKFCSKVTIIHRRDEFRAEKVLVEELLEKASAPDSNIEIMYDTVLDAIEGEGKVERALLRNIKTGETTVKTCDGVFVFVGMVPGTGFLEGCVELEENGLIKCDAATLKTSMPGVFVAGDCRSGAAMQLATAIGDGVLAALMLKNYIRDPQWW
ncbi:MAG: NAD(P)/FAD-dependent oxidoreductase [Phycisphaerae bacterium]|jgi:thioredoxin reductase (NADPH)